MNFLKPGVYLSGIEVKSPSIYFEPPNEKSCDPTFGYNDLEDNPFPPKMFYEVADDLANSFVVEFRSSPYNQVACGPARTYIACLNCRQRYVLACNFLHILHIFVGELMEDRIKYAILSRIKQMIYNLARCEISPGVWENYGDKNGR